MNRVSFLLDLIARTGLQPVVSTNGNNLCALQVGQLAVILRVQRRQLFGSMFTNAIQICQEDACAELTS